MVEWIEERESLEEFVRSDPIRNAVMIQRIFHPRGESRFLVNDRERIETVAVMEKPENDFDTISLAIQSKDLSSAKEVLLGIPPGKYWFHLADEGLLPILRESVRMGWFSSSWLLSLRPDNLRREAKHETRKIDAEFAGKIARAWAHDWDATEYIRERIEKGPSSGAFIGDDLVAWNLTHFETEEVGMAGMLVVLPEHRGRGYAESVTIGLARQIFARGRVTACHIYEDNEASLKMSEGLGFTCVCKQVWGDFATR